MLSHVIELYASTELFSDPLQNFWATIPYPQRSLLLPTLFTLNVNAAWSRIAISYDLAGKWDALH